MTILFSAPPLVRPRRNRKTAAIRSLVQETRLHTSNLVYPQFVIEGNGIRDPIDGMPGICRQSIDFLLREVEEITELGIRALALFPVIPREMKDFQGTQALNPDGVLQKAIGAVKVEFPEMCVIADVALDPYTSHGHDGLLSDEGEILNDSTIDTLVKMALLQAEMGIDMVAPSDMMDGRVKVMRQALDAAGFSHVSIHAYSVKYASAFYGPFRNALGSHLQCGDKKTYQMNPANRREALLESTIDEQEGADILMIKPALPYLDVISKIREQTNLPISAYQVSGEYAMIMAAAQNGWIDGDKAIWESILSIKRAGADMIFTYAAPKMAHMITSGAHD
jgi:porphobilinogen synthase